MPGAVKNEKNEDFTFDGTTWPANTFVLHPGDVANEYSVLRWVAPESGAYQVDAAFRDIVIHGSATVDVHMIKESADGSKKELWNGWLNLNGSGKDVELSTRGSEESNLYLISSHTSILEGANVSSMAFFDVLRKQPLKMVVERLPNRGAIRIRVELEPGRHAEDVMKLNVLNRKKNVVPISHLIAME